MSDQTPETPVPSGAESTPLLHGFQLPAVNKAMAGVPWNVIERLRPLLKEAGVELPVGMGEKVPEVMLGGVVRDLEPV